MPKFKFVDKFKVGDKVKIVGDEVFFEPKKSYVGQLAKITEVYDSDINNGYKLDIDNGTFFWRDNELTSVAFIEMKPQVYTSNIEIDVSKYVKKAVDLAVTKATIKVYEMEIERLKTQVKAMEELPPIDIAGFITDTIKKAIETNSGGIRDAIKNG